jgi:hypothetical protein
LCFRGDRSRRVVSTRRSGSRSLVRAPAAKIAMTGFPGIAFDVQFKNEEEAVLFERMVA